MDGDEGDEGDEEGLAALAAARGRRTAADVARDQGERVGDAVDGTRRCRGFSRFFFGRGRVAGRRRGDVARGASPAHGPDSMRVDAGDAHERRAGDEGDARRAAHATPCPIPRVGFRTQRPGSQGRQRRSEALNAHRASRTMLRCTRG